MLRSLLFSFVVAMLPVVASAGEILEFNSGKLAVEAEFSHGPWVSDESILRLVWIDKTTNQFVNPPAFEVILWMPDHGHGSSPTDIKPVVDSHGKVRKGFFDVTSMYYVMAGTWDTHIVVTYPDGTQETRTLVVVLD